MIKKGNGYRFTGIVLISAAVICNEWVLTGLLQPPGPNNLFILQMTTRFCQLLFLGFGLFFILRRQDKLGDDLKNLGLLLSSIFVCLIILEVFLRLVIPASVFHPGLELIPFLNNEIIVDLPGVADRVHHSTNKWGLRGDPIPKNWDSLTSILTIGGSTTHCMYLSDDDTWPALLQKYLRQDNPSIMVQNAGLDGHTTFGHFLMMTEVVPVIKPKIVMMLVGVNDLNVAVRRSYHRADDPLARTLLSFRLFAYSRTLQVLFKWYQILLEKVPIVDRTEYGSPRIYQPKPFERNNFEPDLLSSAESLTAEFHYNLTDIIGTARTLGIRLLFLTQPSLYDDIDYWKGIKAHWFNFENDSSAFSAATEWKLLAVFNQVLIDVCKCEGVACFDLASAFPHNSEYFYDHYHFNELGAELVAQEIYSYINESRFLDAVNF